jgi:hypothetical protein
VIVRACLVATLVASLVPGVAAARVAPSPSSSSSPATTPDESPAETTSAEPTAEPPSAPAVDEDPRVKAASAFLEGSKAFELGQFGLAVEKFELAWELSREPLLLFNLGQAQYRWFGVDGDPDHLRRARVYYQNYDKRMRGSEGYNDDEIEAILRSLELELEKAEEGQEGRVDRELAARAEADRRRALIDREKRIVRGFNASGNTLIVVGAVTLVMGITGILIRTANKVVLDNSSGGDRGPNLSTAEEDARQRKNFLVGGQLAFSGFIIAGILLPAGIALRVVGEVRERRALGASAKSNARAKLDLDAGGLPIRF